VLELQASLEKTFKTPQVLINAAGVFGPVEPLSQSDMSDWVRTINVNLVGPYLMCRVFVPAMIRLGWGRVINISSASSLKTPRSFATAYITAKVGLNQLTLHLAAELHSTGVTANLIHPGEVKTSMWEEIQTRAAIAGVDAEPLRRWAEWVVETGGDPPEKAVSLVLRLIDSTSNGEFAWIDNPLQDPTQTGVPSEAADS
jgi:NAD(P)-dependent dehydrogenase (short-subunit alcohol dehydrogenase family)